MQDLRRRMEGCWLGKNIGGVLGAPFEGFPNVNRVTYYDPLPTGAEPNDDVELQVMYAAALSRRPGRLAVDRHVLADIWRNHLSFHCDEYAVALVNLARGLRPPHTGSYDNYHFDGMGAAIRSELWACLAPGDPALAAKLAYEDACIDHAGDGIDAEVFLAALEAAAFRAEAGMEALIGEALAYVAPESRLRAAVAETVARCRAGEDFLAVRNRLFDAYASEFRTCVLPNVPFTVLALLQGGGDFGKTVCMAVNCGMDTDCTAATAGAVLGILDPGGIPRNWSDPVGRGIAVRATAVRDLECPADIDALCDMIDALRERLDPEARIPPPPVAVPEYPVRRIDFAVRSNLRWYRVDLDRLAWQPLTTAPINGRLDLPMENGGDLQVVLRIPFAVPETGLYTVMFNSASSNQCYLDPADRVLHDDRHLTFGRIRLWSEEPAFHGRFRASPRQRILAPTLGGAPLNQYKRYLPLEAGAHELYVALEPLPTERSVSWQFGVGLSRDEAFLVEEGAVAPESGLFAAGIGP